jgi:rubrerythrin
MTNNEEIIYQWHKDNTELTMFFEIFCQECGNTYTADNLEDDCPVCKLTEDDWGNKLL